MRLSGFSTRQTVAVISVFAWILVIISGLALAASFTLPFEKIRAYADSQSYSGSATLFSRAAFERLLSRVRVFSFMGILSGSLLYARRRQASVVLHHTLTTYVGELFLALKRFVEWLARETAFWYAMWTITILGIFIRLLFLFQPIRYDEAYTALRFASRSLLVVLTDYRLPNNHILHSLLTYFVYHLIGGQPWMLRLPALLAGVCLIPLCYGVARLLYDAPVALFSAALLAVNASMVDFSTNARGYTLLTLFFLILAGLGIYLKIHRNPAAWIGFVVAAALGFYTIPVMLYPFGTVLVWMLLWKIFEPRNCVFSVQQLAIAGIATTLTTVLLYAPALLVADIRIAEAAPQRWHDFVAGFPVWGMSVWNFLNAGLSLGIQWILLAGVGLSLLIHKRISAHAVPLILAALWCLPMVCLQRVHPFPRVWLWCVPVYNMAAAAGMTYAMQSIMDKLGWNSRAVGITAILSIAIGLSVHVIVTPIPTTDKQIPYAPNLAIFLKDTLRPGDTVSAILPTDTVLWYYFDLYDIPLQYLFANPNDGVRNFFAVDTRWHSIDRVLQAKGAADSVPVDALRVVWDDDLAVLYEYNRQRE